jgi:ribonucleoside-triphosphate reductase
MKKNEMDFRKVLEVYDPDFSEFMMEQDYNLLDIDGVTRINPFRFRKEYWSKPTDEVTINPNANLGNTGYHKNFCNLISEVMAPINKLSAISLIRKYGNRTNSNGNNLANSIINGELYHHNLTLYDLPYCIGLSVFPITTEGLSFGGLLTNTPHRPTSFVNVVIRYIQIASNHFAGATALTDFFANYSYYTAQHKDYSDKDRENDLQNLIHGITDEVRLSGQSPFTNLSILGPDTLRFMFSNYLWGKTKVTDIIDEIMHNQEIYSNFIEKGQLGPDRKPVGIPYRFPITTLVADSSFEKEFPEQWQNILKGNANLCHLNILSNMSTDLKSLAMCCRLQQSLEDLMKINVNNTFGSFLQVGSHAIVSINLPRIAYETKDETKFFEILEQRCEYARQLLKIHRNEILSKRRIQYNYFFNRGYLDLKRNFFSTIGFIGLANALEILNLDITKPDGLKFAEKILKTIKDKTLEFAQKDEVMYNVEEVPAESAAGTLAQKDKELFKGKYSYYDSQFVPLSYDIDILKRIEIEGDLQEFCTGGAISHLNLDGRPDAESLSAFTDKILRSTKLRHFAFNAGFTVCKSGHTSMGIFKKCPQCNSDDLEWITRIVGYFSPVSSWNRAKQAEFKTRKWSKID